MTEGAESKTSIPDRPLSLEYATHLLADSFYFSQGNPELQHEIFKQLHSMHPTWVIEPDLKSELIERATDLAKRRLKHVLDLNTTGKSPTASILHTTNKNSYGNYPMTPTTVDDIVEEQVTDMESVFSGPVESSMRDFAHGVVFRDYYFLVGKKGRPRVLKGEINPSPRSDPWLSHMVFYGTDANPTGYDEFDAMFKAAIPYLKSDQETAIYYGDVEKVHREKHPIPPNSL